MAQYQEGGVQASPHVVSEMVIYGRGQGQKTALADGVQPSARAEWRGERLVRADRVPGRGVLLPVGCLPRAWRKCFWCGYARYSKKPPACERSQGH
jgi:hypothetical protein